MKDIFNSLWRIEFVKTKKTNATFDKWKLKRTILSDFKENSASDSARTAV